MTLAVLPLNIGLSMIMFHLSKRSFDEVGLIHAGAIRCDTPLVAPAAAVSQDAQ